MPAEFQIIGERVCRIKYSDPLQAAELDSASAELTAYAEKSAQSIIVVGDYSDVTQLTSGLVSVGLRPSSANPLRNPNVEKIVVITQLQIIYNVASVVSNILRIEKLVVVKTLAESDREIERFLHK